MITFILGIAVAFLAITVVLLAAWLHGVCMRLDRVTLLARKCEAAITTGRHMSYEAVDCE